MAENSKWFSLFTYVVSLCVNVWLVLSVQIILDYALVPIQRWAIPIHYVSLMAVAITGPVISIVPDITGILLTVVDVRLQKRYFSRISSDLPSVAPGWAQAERSYWVAAGTMGASVGARLIWTVWVLAYMPWIVQIDSAALDFWIPLMLSLWILALALSSVSIAIIISAGLHRHK